jgi:hypothetical protein
VGIPAIVAAVRPFVSVLICIACVILGVCCMCAFICLVPVLIGICSGGVLVVARCAAVSRGMVVSGLLLLWVIIIPLLLACTGHTSSQCCIS